MFTEIHGDRRLLSHSSNNSYWKVLKGYLFRISTTVKDTVLGKQSLSSFTLQISWSYLLEIIRHFNDYRYDLKKNILIERDDKVWHQQTTESSLHIHQRDAVFSFTKQVSESVGALVESPETLSICVMSSTIHIFSSNSLTTSVFGMSGFEFSSTETLESTKRSLLESA
ncbi:hypothetical protein M8C21_029343 [Ambrosia artemisiifolia]|uniref:Uncharacterized protein n=1 Tax=Ambrosia artemisiifolia TaxID=4212 RepID=A0AAD5CGA6_AMBAR|nr:hypothetical protein M8C21_029343 [Ambrosia artemisiifolia]